MVELVEKYGVWTAGYGLFFGLVTLSSLFPYVCQEGTRDEEVGEPACEA